MDASTNALNSNHRDESGSFLWWCAGALPNALLSCPAEHAKYSGIGFAVLATGLAAFISGGYAFNLAFKDPVFAVALGLFWGVVIFNIDRLLVISLGGKDRATMLKMAAMRLGLAAIIGLIISQPLELRLFEREIAQERLFYHNEKALERWNADLKSNADFYETEIKRLQQEITDSETQVRNAHDRLSDEFNGRDIYDSNNSLLRKPMPGAGRHWRENQKILEDAKNKNINTYNKNSKAIEAHRMKIIQFQQSKQTELDKHIENLRLHSGLLEDMHLLNRVINSETAMANTALAITFLFIFVEMLPVLLKIWSGKGCYDIKLAEIQEKDEHTSTTNLDIHKSQLAHLKRSAEQHLNSIADLLADHLQSQYKHISDTIENSIREYMDSLAKEIKNTSGPSSHASDIVDRLRRLVDQLVPHPSDDKNNIKQTNPNPSVIPDQPKPKFLFSSEILAFLRNFTVLIDNAKLAMLAIFGISTAAIEHFNWFDTRHWLLVGFVLFGTTMLIINKYRLRTHLSQSPETATN